MRSKPITVHVIVTCVSPAMRGSSLLVFRTIRTGFPTANILVYSNALSVSTYAPLSAMVNHIGGTLLSISELISHDHFVETLIHKQNEPFWIIDSDVVFYDSVEQFKCPMMGGRLTPQFEDSWTQATHVERLHPSVMYLNPIELRCNLFQWRLTHIPKYFPNALSNLIRQQFTSWNGKTKFHDTMAGIWHAFGGTPFDDAMNAKFEHLYAGTCADAMSKETENYKDLVAVHRVVCDNPAMAKGLFEKQKEFYASHGVTNAN